MPLVLCTFPWNWVLPKETASPSCSERGIVMMGSEEAIISTPYATEFIDLLQAEETKVK